MVGTRDILARGYLPKELPPPFTSKKFAHVYGALQPPQEKDSLCLRYSYSKYAWVRRTLGIPNPAHMIAAADAVSANWAAVASHCAMSTISHTDPVADKERAIKGREELDRLPLARAEIRTGARYAVKADVANFYGSLYTHAIPWAFHTKTVAKTNRRSTRSKSGGPPLFGNVIDAAFQGIQSGQTIGIPIGPDISFAVAEAVLCSVDAVVQRSLGAAVPSFRFVDDYEFACGSLTEAEKVRVALQDALAEFELQLNPRKTRIIELPDVLDTPWAHELASFALDSTNPTVQEGQVLRYMSRAFDLVRKNPGEPVLKYSVRRLADPGFGNLQPLLQKLLFQAAAVDPGTLHTALYVAYEHRQLGGSVETSALSRALSAIVAQHAPLQHGGDVAWALWGAIVFGVILEEDAIRALEQLIDPVAVLVALHAEQEGILARPLDKTLWASFMTPGELFDARWLLAYEGAGKNWVPTKAGDPAISDPFFASARAKQVSFYDETTKKEIPPLSAAGKYK